MFKRVFSGLATVGRACGAGVSVIARDVIGLAGVGLISYGAWTIMPAAGYIVGGVLIVAGTLVASRS